MLAARVGVAALRRGAAPVPGSLGGLVAARLVGAAGPLVIQARPVATSKLSPDEGRRILAAQRLHRPVSPHLGIYKLEQTWFGASAWTRITGCALSGAAYLYLASYLAAPLLGLHLESASVAAAFAALPLAAKAAAKLALAFPFAFHCINGVKHLVYDLGKGFAKPAIKRGEVAVWLSSFLGALYLVFGL